MDTTWDWPEVILVLGLLAIAIVIILGAAATWLEFRKTTHAAAQDDQRRQLISRYEQLAEKTLDTQQRIAADLSELRTRTAAIEQILRTVD